MKTNQVTEQPRRETGTAESTWQESLFVPPVDIVEKDTELTLFMDLPGVRPEDVSVDHENGILEVRGKAQRPASVAGRRQLRGEYVVGDFARTFRISDEIDPQGIRAECSRGILVLHLPKAPAAQRRRIQVKAI